MATYYKYAERNVDNEINWAEIGKGMTEMLSSEAKLREQKKAAVDAASRAFGETLSNAPQGENQGLNTWSLEYADSAQQARLMQDRLLKSGQLKPRDYNIMRQNLNDGTKAAFSLVKEYNAEYDVKMKRMQDGVSSAQEQWEMTQLEGFGNFSGTSLYINPTDFNVSVGKKVKGEDGVMRLSENPNDFSSVNSLRNRLKGKVDKFDVSKNLSAGVNDLGKRIEVIRKDGVLTREDAMQSPGFMAAENTFLDSLMVNPTNVGSVLTDYMKINPDTGNSWEFTLDKDATDENTILLVQDPANPSSGRLVPSLTDKQEEMAKEALRTKFRTMLDFEEKARAEFAPQRTGVQERMLEDAQLGYMKDIDKIMSGTPEVFEAAVADRIEDVNRYNESKNIDSKISLVERTPEKITIYFEEPNGRRVETIGLAGKDNETIAQELSRYFNPGMGSFSSAYNIFNKTEGGFTSAEGGIAPASRGLGFTEKPNVLFMNTLSNPKDTKSKTIQEKFNAVGGDIDKAANLVNETVKNLLSDITSDISVQAIDEIMSGTNTVKVTIDGEIYDIKYDDDELKLSSDIEKIVNDVINEYNNKGGNKSIKSNTAPVPVVPTTQDVELDEFGVPIE